jgi:phosphatidylglycerophosphatase A
MVPLAPGTCGTLVGMPLVWWSADWSHAAKAALWAGLFGLGTWAARVVGEVTGQGDNQKIVIDEVVGVGITAWTAGTNPVTLVAAFVLFRIFDVIKPPPIRAVDQWSKRKGKESGVAALWYGGFGVMADDLLAGVEALILIRIAQAQGWLG